MKKTSTTRSLRPILRSLLASTLAFAAAYGGPVTADDLAGAATNPLGNLIQLQMQYMYNGGFHNSDDSAYTATLQPVIPITLPFESVPLVITRTTIPYVNTPEIEPDDVGIPPALALPSGGFNATPDLASQSALGDIVTFAAFLPDFGLKGHMIGIGPAASLPLASNNNTGSGKWELGPIGVYVNTNTPTIQWGGMVYHLWDVADSQADRHSVNKTFMQPVFNKHFKGGWYVGLQDVLWSYDWRNEKWNIPLGMRFGRVTKIGKQPVNLFVEPMYQPIDDGVQMEWAIKLNITLLFPK